MSVRKMPNSTDLFLIGLIACCVFLAVGGVFSAIETREAATIRAGGRQVDVHKVRKQMSEGELSGHKALFFKKVPQ